MENGKTRYGKNTRALHAGLHASDARENSLAMHVTSSFFFNSAGQAAAVFGDEEEGNIYSRFSNPTVEAFEQRLAELEEGEACVATASGMAAIFGVFMQLLQQGDHLILSRSVFGSTINVAKNYLTKFGIQIDFVGLADMDGWRRAIRPNTKMFYLESPANPTLEMADLAALGQLAKEHGIKMVVDNVFCTPILQNPLNLGAHLVVHSATKYLDGQGRVLGGGIVGDVELIEGPMRTYMRNAGPALSPFNAWVLYKGLETLGLRVERHCANAMQVAQALFERADTTHKVRYPGLESHPQHGLACQQMRGFGGVLCLDLEDRARAYAFMDRLQLATITANLGDSKTLVTHPASTTHARVPQKERIEAGIGEGLVRFSIGLEDAQDIVDDLMQALPSVA
ncbi:Cystathionine gamma-synthase [Magnetococcus marinus MC-1]|uniref:O-succinylhomoserine sulfhydrylase n=1 Tax=Magnetococcus marinus (strain ATCC BAA-1437 / JCM 17883 / MC-1) TaxID=156889 RepID=A0L907_MAGMM|nr:O-succinylhomoserine sulfhydrylase [Magnetococcus marinus]ABK44450.1 Cystathionine gamma-synthase [Magnetococcus marinus MC-1]